MIVFLYHNDKTRRCFSEIRFTQVNTTKIVAPLGKTPQRSTENEEIRNLGPVSALEVSKGGQHKDKMTTKRLLCLGKPGNAL